tara:strand:+ start:785 stop:1480 length:696 start_codon:yes stop_codon:yes gene_type:complete
MNILGVIPARSGSKGILKKNIKKLGGIPLIVHTIKAAKKSNINELVVSTDSKEIAEIAELSGVETKFLRPIELATDTSSSIDVIIHAINKMEQLNSTRYDAVMMLQPTTPFRDVNDINNSIKILAKNKDADSVISVTNVEGNHPARMKYIENNILIDPLFCEKKENQNRQELKEMFIRNGAIYLARRKVLLNRSFKGKKSLALIMSKNASVNIDTKDDFEFAEYIYNKYYK